MPVIKSRLVASQSHQAGVERRATVAFMVSVPLNGDPLVDPQIPTVGAPLPLGTEHSSITAYRTVRARRLSAYRFITRNIDEQTDLFEVEVEYGDGWIPETINGTSLDKPDTYQWAREELRVPFFRRFDRFYRSATPPPLPGGCTHPSATVAVRYEWLLEPMTIFLPFMVKSRIVWVPRNSVGPSQRRYISSQIGKLHQIGETWARMEPPRMVDEDNRRTRIEYAWMYDPGNGPFQPDSAPCRRFIVPTIARPAFHRYRVVPGATPNDPPVIEVYNTMPGEVNGVPNPFVNANGHLALAGQPLDAGEEL